MIPGEDRDDDAGARTRALDVTRSFVVQAPAGSGKTELLIQRYLALLARVERPERVLAITFTRKAAGEMRERVVRALVAARLGHDDALPPHERVTRRLARAVLAQDDAKGWNLVAHPSRLAVRTIDALAQAIALQAPLASGLPPSPRFTEAPTPLYVETVRAALHEAGADDPTWRSLLEHQDNNADALAAFLAAMLARRDQWLELLRGDAAGLRATLEAALAGEVEAELTLHAATLRSADLGALCRVAALAARHLGEGDAALRDVLSACAARGAPPPIDVEHAEHWKAIARWLMTGGETLRKSAQRMPGIPPVGEGEGRQQRSDQAKDVARWLASLAATPGVEGALVAIARLPPVRYDDDGWRSIASLLALLRPLAARLSTVFASAGEFDFAQGTLAALAALGTGDEPTDLLLRLDLAVDHILVDEFQDTSYAHLDLLGRLMAGWSDGDGRTLFAVGDPMQSIYGFRGAEVRAFVEAQRAGRIEGIAVEPLRLARNFRSQAGLVDWVNERFPAVLGSANDPWRGRVSFAAATPVKPRAPHEPCTVDFPRSAEDEAAQVVMRVREALQDGGDVAVLVRSRAHLSRVLPALRAAGIAYDAVELDVLAERPAVRDVAALAHALVQPDDRLAWLAVLRAPWCGLALADLHAVVRAADRANASVAAIVSDPPADTLSADGHARLARVAAVVARAKADVPRASLAERVHDAWMALGGPATLDDPLDLVAVDDVVALIAAHERAGDLDDWNAFAQRLADEKLSPKPGEGARVQVMTMHKAKGLEFDAVILPGLASGRARHDPPFLRWRMRRDGLLIGLAKPQGGEHDGVYAYLKALADDEERAELARLAYVACTRAKGRLALIATLRARAAKAGGWEWSAPGEGALFGILGSPGFDALAPPDGPGDDPARDARAPTLARLPAAWMPPARAVPLAVPATVDLVEESLPFEWVHERARRLGVVVHRVLAQLAAEGLEAWDVARLASHRDRWAAELVAEGALPADAAAEAADVSVTLAAVVGDARGRWLFDPSHEDARSEWAIAGLDAGAVVHVVLDRTFVAQGERWIVDFKTGTHEGADPARFLDSEAGRYRKQLERYRRIVGALDPAHPIRLALYHPRVQGGWRELT